MINPAQFVAQVRAEASKVVWPTRKEAGLTTAMVLLMAVIVAIFFFFVDQIMRIGVDLLLAI
ncbi:MAG: preprotein translocase subunit SecE [Pseudomonadota bacterium]